MPKDCTIFAYGNHTVLLNFVILAYIFMVVKAMNTMKNSCRNWRKPPINDQGMPAMFSTIPIRAVRCLHCTQIA